MHDDELVDDVIDLHLDDNDDDEILDVMQHTIDDEVELYVEADASELQLFVIHQIEVIE